jgi:hypothetical protein
MGNEASVLARNMINKGGEVSDTPRTDEAEFHPIADSYAYVVDSDFARTLERESAELRMDYEGQRDSEEASVRVANELLAERDALRVEVARLEGEVIARPICGKCGGEMTPDNSTVRPELFLHDECLPPELQRVAAVVSQTPRTDAEEADDWTPGARLVPADLARTLERENAALSESHSRAVIAQANRELEVLDRVKSERDALRAEVARLRQIYHIPSST